MTGTTFTVAALALFGVAAVLLILRIVQTRRDLGSRRAALIELAAGLLPRPDTSASALRRRFARALTGQCVVMPSGERLAFGALTVRIAPEDRMRLDPDGDLERLAADGAGLYLTHAERAGWRLPADVQVTVDVDPALRSGWIPPARGGPSRDDDPGWDGLGAVRRPTAVAAEEPTVVGQAPGGTVAFPEPADLLGTIDLGDDLWLRAGGESVRVPRRSHAVLGRHPDSPIRLDDPVVSVRHAALRHDPSGWQIKDLGSTNGTTLDGEPVGTTGWTRLSSGAVLALAGVEIGVVEQGRGTVALG